MAINLIPWREQQRQRKNRHFSIIAGLILLGTTYLNMMVNQQENTLLQSSQAKNKTLMQKINILEPGLKPHKNTTPQSAAYSVKFLNYLGYTLPITARLNELELNTNTVVLKGYCTQPKEMNEWLEKLQKQAFFQEFSLNQLKKQQRKTDIEFTVQFKIKNIQ